MIWIIKFASIIFIFLSGLISLLAPSIANCQSYCRIHAQITVKSKLQNDIQSLTIGEVSYDRNKKQIIYKTRFPETECWVLSDSLIYRIKGNTIESKSQSLSSPEFSIFHLALSSHLQNFGLDQTNYQPESVIKEEDQVITTWAPPPPLLKKIGKIKISSRDKQLFGVIFFDPDGNILRKQFFEDYKLISGLAFPCRIVEINTVNGTETYQITTFKNIIIDEPGNDTKYFYNINTLHN